MRAATNVARAVRQMVVVVVVVAVAVNDHVNVRS